LNWGSSRKPKKYICGARETIVVYPERRYSKPRTPSLGQRIWKCRDFEKPRGWGEGKTCQISITAGGQGGKNHGKRPSVPGTGEVYI